MTRYSPVFKTTNMDPSQAPEVVQERDMAHHNQYNAAPNSPVKPPAEPTKRNKVAGLAPATFWLLVALVVVTIAAAVGGGVGGGLAVKNAKKSHSDNQPASACNSTSTTSTSINSSSSSSPSTTSSAPYRAPSGTTLPMDCTTTGDTYTLDWNGAKIFDLTCNGIRHYGDTTGFRAYSLNDCLIACVKLNSLWWSTACTAVAFDSNLSGEGATNCFLKNVTIAKKDIVTQKGAVLAVLKNAAEAFGGDR